LSNYDGGVAKTWVLDTATKGTGANVVPLDHVQARPASPEDKLYVPRKPRPKQPREPKPQRPRQFKIVDVVTRETLAEHVDARSTLRILRDVRSSVDVHVYVHDPVTEGWRLLSLNEQRALWGARHRVADAS
jgi:hypothetical protein